MDENGKKRFGIVKILLILAGLLLVVLIVLPFVIDANQFRPMIESELTAALGRAVKVGDLHLSLLAGSIEADAISIADDRNFSPGPFVSARSLRVGVEMWPLVFSRALKITSLSLVNPEVTLIRAATGKWNFSSLGGGAAATATERSGDPGMQPASADVSIRVLNVTGGRVTIIREGANLKPYLLDKVNLKVQDLSLVSVFPFTLTASSAPTVRWISKCWPD